MNYKLNEKKHICHPLSLKKKSSLTKPIDLDLRVLGPFPRAPTNIIDSNFKYNYC